MSRYNTFPSRHAAGGFGVPPTRSSATSTSGQTAGSGHDWGRGRVLGGNID